MKETNLPHPPPNTPGPFSLSDEKLLKEYLAIQDLRILLLKDTM